MAEYISNGESALSVRNKLNNSLITPAEFSYSGNVVSITAPENAKYIEFTVTVDYDDSYTYNLNGENISIKNIFNPNDYVFWKSGSMVIGLISGNTLYIFSVPQKAPIEEVTFLESDDRFVTPKYGNLLSLFVMNPFWKKIKEYESHGSYQWNVPDFFGNGTKYIIGVLIIGGGGSGGAVRGFSTFVNSATGGASGHSLSFLKEVTPGDKINIVVGAGGEKIEINSDTSEEKNGNNGGSTSFGGISVDGGHGGNYGSSTANGAYGGQNSIRINTSKSGETLDGGYGCIPVPVHYDFPNYNVPSDMYVDQIEGWNPFELKRILGSGAACISNKDYESKSGYGGKNPITGKGGGDSCGKLDEDAVAMDADDPGSGGGAASNASPQYTYRSVISGAGADGAVYIYMLGRVENQ